MWGHDAPHKEGSAGHATEALRNLFADFAVEDCVQMFTSTAAKLYSFDQDALASLANRIGPRVAEVHTPLVDIPVSKGSAFWEPTDLRRDIDRLAAF
jgi:hypothetical protein